jgi:hypothetical protein
VIEGIVERDVEAQLCIACVASFILFALLLEFASGLPQNKQDKICKNEFLDRRFRLR